LFMFCFLVARKANVPISKPTELHTEKIRL
jgi:hypothetical protein